MSKSEAAATPVLHVTVIGAGVGVADTGDCGVVLGRGAAVAAIVADGKLPTGE